jgi:hypothetical protein
MFEAGAVKTPYAHKFYPPFTSGMGKKFSKDTLTSKVSI